MILKERKIPEGWKLLDTILLHKKGDKHKIINYRPISLGATIAKIFSKALEKRLRGILNEQQPREQAGFRKNFSTTDHLHTMNILIEKCEKYQIGVYCLLIDYTKAFDSVKQSYLINALGKQGVPETYIEIIADMYSNLKSRIVTDVKGPYFSVESGVRQGDLLSSTLFNCLLEEVFRSLDWGKKGINISGENLSNLRFADDVILIATDFSELREMVGAQKFRFRERD